MSNLVAGVDFSGAKTEPNNTWLAVGRITTDAMEIVELRKVGSHALAMELQKLASLSAVGMDFPFSLPVEFIQFAAKRLEGKSYQEWHEVVEHLAFMPYEEFLDHAKAFKAEPKRITDEMYKAQAISPLHRGNPSMIQMTLEGMRTLAKLDPSKFAVMPFYEPGPGKCTVLEVFPRATLWCLSLPDKGYKSADPKDLARVHEARKTILNGLIDLREHHPISCKDYPKLSLGNAFRSAAIDSDHALDAVIACYTTGVWKLADKLFPDPYDANDENVLLEGWIYAPRNTREK